MIFNPNAIGNFLGAYFDSIACAAETGTHFVGVKKELLGHDRSIHEKFYDGLPDIIVNPKPVDHKTAVENVKRVCSCDRFCWRKGEVWEKQIPLIRNVIDRSLRLHLTMTDKHYWSTSIV